MLERRTPRPRGRLRRRLSLIAALAGVLAAAACTSAVPKAIAGVPSATRSPQRQSAPGLSSLKDVAGQPIPFGRAHYFGGVRPAEIGSGIVGMASSPDGHGYWIATASGTVFGFGDAVAYASALSPKGHVVAIVPSGVGVGYWLACSTGAVVAFGDASLRGSPNERALSTPIVAMAATPDARGYWLAASGGRVFGFGDAHLYGSATAELDNDHVVAMADTPDGKGYWLAASDGQVFPFGDARSYGSAASVIKRSPVVAIATVAGGRGYWLLPTRPPAPVGLPAPGVGFLAGHVTAIGDSVMLDAQPALQADIPGIDVEAAVSRQWYEGVDLVQQLKAEDRLGAIVVIDLGTNGPVTPQQFADMMDVLAGASRVVFVTVHLPPSYSWAESVNATLKQCVPLYPRDRLADFNKLADENPEWFYGDGVHMPIGGAGAQAMTSLIKAQI